MTISCSTIKRVYSKFNFPGALKGSKTLLTGIRPIECSDECSEEYLITGFYEYPDSAFQTASFVFKGNLDGVGKFFILNFPSTPENQVDVTNLYGPNNGICCNGFCCSQFNIVGNYTLVGENSTIGCLYQGPLDGTGKWTTIIPQPLSNEPILNTICHSNMGNLVVGNYDTQVDEGKAFIYDMKKKTYTNISMPDAISITAYGIWHNCGESYTICGGFFASPGVEMGYLVDYNRSKKKFSNWATFKFNNSSNSIITHFDGISSDGCCGYTLTGDYVAIGAGEQGFFARVKRDKCGKFCEKAFWSTLKIKGAEGVSGNTVSEDVVVGVFNTTDDETTVNGYISITEIC